MNKRSVALMVLLGIAATWTALRAQATVTLTAPTVSPAGGVPGIYSFGVVYTDPENLPPAPGVQLTIEDTGLGTPVAGSPFTMIPVNPGDTDYTDGAMYRVAVNLPAGDFRYQFTASNGGPPALLGPVTGLLVNTVPVLSAPGFSPPSGPMTTSFEFQVTYRDADNDAPAFVEAIIDGSLAVPLSQQDGKPFTTGSVFGHTLPLPPGFHNYYLRASDGRPNGTVVFPAGSDIDSAKRLAGPVNGAKITGTVTVAGTGAPVAGATVSAGSFSAITGSNGNYTLYTADGTYSLSASAPQPQNLLDAASPLTVAVGDQVTRGFSLAVGGTLTGVVRDPAGAPVGGATVNVTRLDGSFIASGTTDTGGSFSFTRMPGGNVLLEVTGELPADLMPQRVLAATTQGQTTTQNVTLLKGATLTCNVTDGALAAVPNARVVVDGLQGSQYAFTDTSGTATFGGLAAGHYSVQVTPDYSTGLQQQLRYVDLAVGENRSLSFILSGAGVLTGVVRDSLGAGVGYATVQIRGTSSGYANSATTDSGGLYRIQDIVAGTYSVEVIPPYASSFLRASRAGVQIVNGTQTTADFTLAAGGTVTGTVRDGAGAPVSAAYVQVRTDSGTPGCSTDTQGRYTISGLPRGNWQLEVDPPYGSPLLSRWHDFVSVTPGQTTTRDVQLPTGARIRVTVTSGATPVANVYIATTGAEASTGSDGVATLGPLEAGTYQLGIYPSGGGLQQATVEGVTVQAGQTRDVAVGLKLGGTVGGTILDHTGAPVSGATVILTGAASRSTTTGQNGVFGFSSLPSGSYQISARPPSGAPLLSNTRSFYLDPAQMAMINLTLGRSATIQGRVTDSSGAPIPNAGISLSGTGFSGSATAASDGSYQIVGMPAGTYSMTVWAPYGVLALATTLSDIPVTLGSPVVQDVRLEPAGTLSGVVRAPSGQPFTGGATVHVYYSHHYQSLHATTGLTDGTFHVFPLPVGPVELQVVPNGAYLPASVKGLSITAGGTTQQDVTLVAAPAPGAVRVAVGFENAPLANANVTLSLVGSPGSVGSMTTGTDGIALFSDLAPGTYAVSVQPPSGVNALASGPGSIPVAAGATVDVPVTLPKGAAVEGRVTDGGGLPVSDASLALRATTGTTGTHTATSRTDGSYRIEGLPAGTYELTVWPPSGGALASRRYAGIVVGGGQVVTQNVQLTTGATLRGVVTDSASRPVAGATVSIGIGSEAWTVYSDSDGAYVIPALPAGPCRVSAEPPYGANLLPAPERTVTLGDGGVLQHDITLLVGSTLTGRVTDEAGKPVAGAYVLVSTRYDEYSTRADDAGIYRIEGLSPTPVNVVVSAPDRLNLAAMRADDVQLTSGGVRQFDVVLHGGGVLTGVVSFNGEPVQSAQVMARGANEDYACATDAQGRYTFNRLAPGTYYLQVEPPSNGNLNAAFQFFMVSIGAGAPTVVRDVPLPQEGVLTGTVSDGQGQPVTKGVVTVSDERGRYRDDASLDSNGRFRLGHLATGRYTLSVSPASAAARNLLPQGYAGIRVTAGQETEFNVSVPSGVVFAGTVVDTAGNPVAGATVGLFTASDSGESAPTRPDGTFRIPGVAPGTYTVAVQPPRALDLAPTMANNVSILADTTRSFVLPPQSVFTTTVTDSGGTPVAGAHVVLQSTDHLWYSPQFSEWTDGGGRVRIDHLPAGLFDAVVTPPADDAARGLSVERFSGIRVPRGQNVSVPSFVLGASGAITGIVSDSQGTPVPGVEVFASGPSHSKSATSDSAGRFRVDGLGAGIYWLEARPDPGTGWLSCSVAGVRVALGAPTEQNLVLSRGGTLSGYVRDTARAPVPGAWVALHGASGVNISTQTGPDGSYTVPGLQAQDYRMTVTPTGGNLLDVVIGQVRVGRGEQVTRDVTLPAGGVVEGTVYGPDGTPLVQPRVKLIGAGGDSRMTLGGLDGRYRFEGLRTGLYDLAAAARSGGEASIAPAIAPGVGVTAGQTTPKDMTLPAAGSVLVQVVYAPGSPVVDADVALRVTNPPAFAGATGYATTNSKGEARLQEVYADNWGLIGLPSSVCTVQVYPPAGSSLVEQGSYDVQVQAGAETPVTVLLGSGASLVGRVTDGSQSGLDLVEVSIVAAGGKSLGGSVYTDSAGYFRIDAIPSGTHAVRVDPGATHPLFLARTIEDVQFTAGVETTRNIVLDRGSVLTGTVTDATGGTPVAGASVHVQALDPEGEPTETVADSTGKYLLGGLPPGRYHVVARAPGHRNLAPSGADVTLVLGTDATQDFALVAGGVIEGTIQDENGTPVPWVEVSVAGIPNDGASDSAGMFRIEQLAGGTYDLTLDPPNDTCYGRQQILGVAVTPGEVVKRTFILRQTGEVKGRVTTATGKPVSGARVGISGAPSVTTDSTGAYFLGGVPAGPQTVSVQPAEGSELAPSKRTGVSVIARQTTVCDFTLVGTATVMGTVKDETGMGVEGARIRVELSERGMTFQSQADSVGHYVVTGVPAGRYDITAQAPEGRPDLLPQTVFNVILTSGVTTTQDLTLAGGGTVSGTVLDEAGKPLPGWVKILGVGPDSLGAPTMGGFSGQAQIDPDGRYTFVGVPAGTFTVWPEVFTSVPLLSQQARVTVAAGQNVARNFVLSAGGRVSGRVVGPDGVGVEHIGVSLRRAGAGDRDRIWTGTDASGAYTISGVPPANDYVVRVQVPESMGRNLVAQEKPAVVTAGTETVVNFQLSAGGTVRGRVTDGGGTPVEGARVALRGPAEREVVTGTDGTFEFTGLPEGSYDLIVAPRVGAAVAGRVVGGVAVSGTAPVTRDIQLSPASRVNGIVRNKAGQPVAGVAVWLFGAGKPVVPGDSVVGNSVTSGPSPQLLSALSVSSGGYTAGAVSGGDGTFTFQGLPAGHFTVVTDSMPDLGLAPGTAEVDLGAGTAASLAVVLPQPCAITGVVSGAAGTPLGGVRVTVSGALDWAETTTDAAGRFDFRGLAPGPHEIQVSAPYGEGSGSRRVKVDLSEGATVTQSISLASTGSIGGKVTGASGAVAGAVVRLYGPDHDSSRLTSSDGAFLFEHLAPGVFHIEITPPRGAALNGGGDELVLAAGQDLRKEFLLPAATGAISGEIAFAGTQSGPVLVALFQATSASEEFGSPDLAAASASTLRRSGRSGVTRGWAAVSPTAFGTDSPLFQVKIPGPGPFTLVGIPDGAYHLLAVMDLNGNGQVDPGEPAGKFGRPNAIFVSRGAAVGGIRVNLLVPFAAADVDFGRVVPRTAVPGGTVTLLVKAFGADAARAVVHPAAGGSAIGTVDLLDDGKHNDGAASDAIYGATFTLPAGISGDYTVDFAAADVQGNWTGWSDSAGFTTTTFQKTARVLLVSVDANLAGIRLDRQGNAGGVDVGFFASPLNGLRPIEDYYAEALRASNVPFDVWRTVCRGPVPASVMKQYAAADSAVIIACPHEVLSEASGIDGPAIGQFLDAGGRLFLSGQDIAWETEGDDRYHFNVLFHDYLCAGFVRDSASYELSGRRGDVLADGMRFRVSGGDGANNQTWTDAIVALPPAQPILHYEESAAAYTRAAASRARGAQVTYPQPGANRPKGRAYVDPGDEPLCGGLRLDNGRYKVVYLSFGFEAIADAGQRALLLRRSLQFLNSPVSDAAKVEAAASVPTLPADGVSAATVTVSVTNAAGSPVADGTLVSFRGYNASVPASALTTGGSVTVSVIAGKAQSPMTVAVSSGVAATNVVFNALPAAAGVIAARSLDATTVEVVFDRPMEKATAENPANYTFTPALTVTAATLASEPSRVVLTTAAQLGIPYLVTAGAVRDAAGQPLGPRTSAELVGSGATPVVAVVADVAKLLANGKDPATLTATVTTSDGSAVPDGTWVTFVTSLGSVSPNKATVTGGRATALLRGVITGMAQVIATCGNAKGSVSVELVDPAPAAIALEASSPSLAPDGSVNVTLTATVTDILGRPMADVPVTFGTDLGTLSPTSAQTVDGRATSILSSATEGTANVTAKTPNGKEATLAVSMPSAGSLHNPTASITIAAGTVVLPDDGTGTTELTITLKDAEGNLVSNAVPVSLATDLGSVPAAGTASGGTLRVTFSAGSTAGKATITVTSGNARGTFTLYVVGPGEPAAVTLTATPDALPADGVSPSVVTATVATVQGQPVADGTEVRFTAVGGTIEATATTVGGKASVVFKAGAEPGTATVTATAGVASGRAEITLTSGTTVKGTVTVPAGQTLPTDGVAELRDAADAVVASTTVQADGTFRLTTQTPGTYDVVVRATGYVPVRKPGVDLTRPTRAVLQDLVFALVPQPALAPGPGLALMTVPYDFRNAEIEKVVGDPETVAYWYNPITKRYQIAGVDGIPPVTVGRGFWLKPRRGGGTYEIVQPGRMPAQDQPITLALDKGWQIIGSPYATGTVTLNQIQVLLPGSTTPLPFGDPATTNQVRGYLWTWNGSAYNLVSMTAEGTTRNLTPFRGYWVRTLVDSVRLVFMPPTRGVVAMAETGRNRAAAADGWRVRIHASVGGSAQGSGCFGIGSSSYAIDAPPAPQGHVDVLFAGPDSGRAAVSVLDQNAAQSGWSFQVAGAPEGRDVTLTWPGLGAVPRTTRLVLVDEQTGRRWQMRTTPSVTFRATGAPQRFRVEAQRATGALITVTGITLSQVRSGGRSIGYVVSGDVTASVTVKSATGRTLCRVVENRAVTRGRNEAYWDGRDERGIAVRGLVLVEVTATTEDGATVRAVQPAMIVQ